jgi:hypothetical protein
MPAQSQDRHGKQEQINIIYRSMDTGLEMGFVAFTFEKIIP